MTVTGKAQQTLRIQWVRSGIGFSHRAKIMIRSLGLRRLRQVVERPDTPQIRGLVAKIPHLVEIVSELHVPTWATVPEYTIGPAAVAEAAKEQKAATAPAEVQEPAARPARERKVKEPVEKAPAPAKAVAAKKAAKSAAAGKGKPAKAAESRRQVKAAAGKGAKGSKKDKK